MEFSGGWDSRATLVDGRWVVRTPRRPEVEAQLLRETEVMPWLAARLPLPVPIPEVVTRTPLVVRHPLVPGEPLESPVAEHGRALGEFLLALHGTPAETAWDRGFPRAERTRDEREAADRRFRAEVLPLLPDSHRQRALNLLDAILRSPADTLVHGDLGPEHVLSAGEHLTGVIDFGDAHIGDRAIDLAWALFGTPAEFAGELSRTYGVTDALRTRALAWHRLGPWYEVLHGADIGDPEVAAEGLTGVLARLG
ncbi:phosphotransferase [Nocardia sp. NPDC005978]|uniref:phosphotransferase n=1 Tax=Nocardia sp. NPDC005978 TaxID=3156725 RepID=UPI0033BE63D4